MTEPVLGRLLGSGKEAEVFEWGSLAIKLYRPTANPSSAFREAAALAVVGTFGLPAPSVREVRQIGNRLGIVMSRADGPAFAEGVIRQPDLIPQYVRRMTSLHMEIHANPGTAFASQKGRLAANIRLTRLLGEARRRALLDGLAALPEGRQVCHGDFHPWNIMGPPGRELVVDWLDACSGDPASDVCRSYVLIRPSAPEFASAYVEAYAKAAGISRDGILMWLPFVAAARLAEGVPDEVDALMEMVDTT